MVGRGRGGSSSSHQVMPLGWLLAVAVVVEAKSPLYHNTRLPVPGHIEMEDFASVGGQVPVRETPRHEPGGGEVLKGPLRNSWANYAVRVAETGLYEVKVRYSKTTGGMAPLFLERVRGFPRLTRTLIRLVKTGPADSFQVASSYVTLTKGEQTIAMRFTGIGHWSGVSINWMAFKRIAEPKGSPLKIEVNPSAGGLQDAFDALAREKQLNRDRPVEILLNGGYHEVEKTIRLSAAHSGTPHGPVTVKKGTGAAAAVIGGGRQVPLSSLQRVTDEASLQRLKPVAHGRVFRARLDDDDWVQRFTRRVKDSLFEGVVTWNGVDMMLARLPNVGLEVAKGIASDESERDGSFTTRSRIDAQMWQRELSRSKTIFVSGHMIADEFEEHAFVSRIEDNGRIHLEKHGPKEHRRTLRILNVLAELDTPGEWYYDAVSRDFYVWPLESLGLDPDIRVGGAFEMLKADDLSFWTVQDAVFSDIGGTFNFDGPAAMVHFNNVQDIVFGGNTIRNTNARVAARFDACVRCVVTANDFYDVGTPFGVAGPRASTLPYVQSQSVFTNNHVTNIRARAYGGGGISGTGVVFAHNLIHGVQAGQSYTQATDALLEQNEWYDLGYELGDFNVAYVGGSYFTLGNVIRHNLVHNLHRAPYRRGVGAFRYDDGGAGMAFVGNVIHSAQWYGLALGGHAGTVTNNIVLDTGVFLLTNQGTGLIGRQVKSAADLQEEWRVQLHDVPDKIKPYKGTFIYNAQRKFGTEYWKSPYFAYKYPLAKRAYDVNPFVRTNFELKRNYIVNVPQPLDGRGPRHTATQTALEGLHGAEMPTAISKSSFEDMTVLNLNLKQSFTKMSGFYDIPVDTVGLKVDTRFQSRQATPHKDTYRAGAELKWKNGAGVNRHDEQTWNNAYPARTFDRMVAYDLGSYTTPLFHRATLLTPETTGSYGWVNPRGLVMRHREGQGNAYNTDVIQSQYTTVFEQHVENGVWYVLVTFGDYGGSLDKMSVRVEQQPYEAGNREFSLPRGQFVNKLMSAVVVDGKLSVEFSSSGGHWSVSRIVTKMTPFGGQHGLKRTALLPSEYVYLQFQHSSKCLDMKGSQDELSPITQWTCTGHINLQFKLIPRGGGEYLLKSRASGKCVDNVAAFSGNGAEIVQATCEDHTSRREQRWRLVEKDRGYFGLVSVAGGGCLDVRMSSRDNHATVQQWGCHWSSNQLVKILH